MTLLKIRSRNDWFAAACGILMAIVLCPIAARSQVQRTTPSRLVACDPPGVEAVRRAGADGQEPPTATSDAPIIGEIVVTGNKALTREAVTTLCGHKVGESFTTD